MSHSEVEADEAYDEPPLGLLLVFDEPTAPSPPGSEKLPPELRSGPQPFGIRPVDVADVLRTVEELWVVSEMPEAPPRMYRKRMDWVRDFDARSLHPRLTGLRMESDLHVLLTLPWPIYVSGYTAFLYGLGHVFGVPYKAMARFHGAREEYWTRRLGDRQARQEFLEWKTEQQQSRLPRFRLKRVDETNRLPPKSDAEEG